MTGILHVLVGSLGVAFGLLVFRADPRRHDNRAFALLGMLDGSMALFRGISSVLGAQIDDIVVLLPCALLSPLLGWASLEFAWSFPFNRPMPWRWRVPVLLATVWAIVFIVIGPVVGAPHITNTFYFIPATLFMTSFQVRNLRRLRGDRIGVKLVVLALILRWVCANALYGLHGRIDPETWGALLFVDSTAIVLVSFVMIGIGSVRSNLFTLRSALGELVMESVFFLSGLVLTAAALLGALQVYASRPVVGVALLLLAALMPLAMFIITERVRPRIEAGVDPRRARRRELLDEFAATSTGAVGEVLAAAQHALATISDGGIVTFVPAAALDDDARAALAGGPVRTGETLRAPVRVGANWHGALHVSGGVLDRETVVAAGLLAERLASACELRRLAGELEEKSRLATLGAFAAAIAHDIRTPLTSVQMNVQVLRGKVALPPDDMEHFDIALEELRRLDGHVRELLDYAKPMALLRETVDVKDVADDAARTIEPLLGERGQVLTREHGPDLPPVAVDAQRLRQVLWNLLDNAAKASPSGSIIALRTRRDGERIAIDVVDRGSGIAAKDLPHIFEPFFTTRPDGTGLGLAICQKVVRGHGGEIVVHSQPASGSTFTIVLPAAA